MTSTKTGTEQIRRTSYSVSILLAEVAAFSGNQSIQSVIAMPISEANTPIPIMRATGCFSPWILGSDSGGPLASSD